MAFIVEQLAGNRGLQLGAEAVVRPFSFGTNWAKIRLGILWAANGYSTIPAGKMLSLGVATGYCSSLSASATDALWLNSCNLAGNMTVAGTAPNVYYTTSTPSTNSYQRVGSTTTITSASVNAAQPGWSANPSVNKSAWFVDITKDSVGQAATSIGHIYMSITQANADVSDTKFLQQLETESAALTGFTRVAQVSTNLPLRFTKDWDSMFVAWYSTTPTACVFRMTVCRFS